MSLGALNCIAFYVLAASAHRSSDGAVTGHQAISAANANANPIRRVVSMLQMMAKKVEAEGEKEKELYEKFMCYCKTSTSTLADSIAANDAKIPQVQSDIEEAESQLAATKQELAQHQTEREAAKAAMAKATEIREKEHAAFLKESTAQKTNIDALSKAIPAIQKGMAGGFLQTSAAALLKRIVISDDDLTDFDRESLATFLQGGSANGYVPKSGEIVGILQQMKDSFEKDLSELEKAEAAAVESYESLMAAKNKEVEAHNKAIEAKSVLIGELSVDIVNMKNDLSESEEALIEDKKFLADLDKNCAAKTKEWEERCKTRADEIVAIQETIKILNDDDALELFKKTLPSPSLLQVKASMDQVKKKALLLLQKTLKGKHHSLRPEIDLIALALTGTTKVDFSKVIKMIDEMVVLLGKEQADDDHKKEYCEKQLDFTEDKTKELGHAIADLDTQIADLGETIKTVTEEIKALNDGIKALDTSVAEATEQRKNENQEFTEMMAANTAAVQLIEFAKNRMNKFYNPKLYKPPPKRELTEEERITLNMGGTLAPTNPPGGIAGTGVGLAQLVSVRATHKDAPPPPPETFGEYGKKSEESNGVIGMMDLLIRDLQKEITEAETEEKNAQEEYEQMMSDAAAKRAEDSKAITEKEEAKADAEADLTAAKDAHQGKSDELSATKKYESQLHSECDWLIENFQIRKDARAEEVAALKDAKAVLSGADFSFMQKVALLRRH